MTITLAAIIAANLNHRALTFILSRHKPPWMSFFTPYLALSGYSGMKQDSGEGFKRKIVKYKTMNWLIPTGLVLGAFTVVTILA